MGHFFATPRSPNGVDDSSSVGTRTGGVCYAPTADVEANQIREHAKVK